MANTNYYDVLGVPKEATKHDIKKAYQKLARKWHPDVNNAPEAELRFKEATEAYEVLGNVEKRKQYDEQLRYGFRGKKDAGSSAGRDFWEADSDGSWSRSYSFNGEQVFEDDLFGMFFGNGDNMYGDNMFGRSFTGRSGRRSRPTQAELEITLEQAYRGGKVQVTLDTEEVAVNIPPRSSSGTVVEVSGKGLLIVLRLQQHELFTEQDGNLAGILQIAPWQAALGGEAAVPLPGEGAAVKLKIPAGISSGQSLRVSGKGLRKPDGSLGDVLYRVEIVVPQPKNDNEKRLYRQLAETGGFRAKVKRERNMKGEKSYGF